jgi:hypothetical protein
MVRFYVNAAPRNDKRTPITPVNNPVRTWAFTDDVRCHRHISPPLFTDALVDRCTRRNVFYLQEALHFVIGAK